MKNRTDLLLCPECGDTAKFFQGNRLADHVSIFCGNPRCPRPAIYYGTTVETAARWNQYASNFAGRKRLQGQPG